MKLKLQFIIAAFIALAIYIPVAHGQGRLTFSGGNNTPLTTTLRTAVTYQINTNDCAATDGSGGPFFVFQNVGNILGGQTAATGNINFSISGGAARPINSEFTGFRFTAGTITANDLALFEFARSGVNGSTVVLSAGTITTTGNVAAAPPATANYPTFITNQAGVICSSAGTSLARPPQQSQSADE